jgi:hypothetical protein
MSETPAKSPNSFDPMSLDYRRIRLNQRLLSSEEMRAQLVRNRLDYARKQQSSKGPPSSGGLKKAG